MNHFIPSLQPEEGAAENVVLLPPKESQNDSVQVQRVCVRVTATVMILACVWVRYL